MLDSGTDRVNYGDLLTAPTGFHLDFALGTTYSLDLDALMTLASPWASRHRSIRP